MNVNVLSEHGYWEAELGFSFSYNTTMERARELLPLFAHKGGGESKFLESMIVWLDVTAPRFWWQEADTYRVGTTKQSESTMHTITRKQLEQSDFEYPIEHSILFELNDKIKWYKSETDKEEKKKYFLDIKNMLPEGFLQRRIWMMSYKTLQNIYAQRYNHRLPQWKYFLDTIIGWIDYPEFIIKDT